MITRALEAALDVGGAALRALKLSREDQRAAVAALALLVAVSRQLRAEGLASTEIMLRGLPRALPIGISIPPAHLASLVDAVARRVPGATCLVRSLTLAHLLLELGHDPALKIGVRPGEKPSGEPALDAHAWVELHGAVLNDSDDVATRFAVIETR
jgi:hypothetical protein